MAKFLISFCFVVFSTVVLGQDSATRYFEGIIEYDIQSKSYRTDVPDSEISEMYGTKFRYYFKNGNYIREYINGSGQTMQRIIYLMENDMVYFHYPIASPDTLELLDPREEVYLSYKIKAGRKEKVLNYNCTSSVISAKYGAGDKTYDVTLTYFFAKELPINPDWHKEMYIWGQLVREQKSIPLKIIEYYPGNFKQTFTASKLMWQPVPDEVFKIDPKLVQVKAAK